MVTVHVGKRAHGVGPGWVSWVQRELSTTEAAVALHVGLPSGEVRLTPGVPAGAAVPDGLAATWSSLGLARAGWELGALARFVAALDLASPTGVRTRRARAQRRGGGRVRDRRGPRSPGA